MNHVIVPYWIASRSSVSTNHGFKSSAVPAATSKQQRPTSSPSRALNPEDGNCNVTNPSIFYMMCC